MIFLDLYIQLLNLSRTIFLDLYIQVLVASFCNLLNYVCGHVYAGTLTVRIHGGQKRVSRALSQSPSVPLQQGLFPSLGFKLSSLS